MLITFPSTLAEMYIVPDDNGVVVKKDIGLFENVVNEMLFTDKYDYMPARARNSYLENYSRYSMGRKIGEMTS